MNIPRPEKKWTWGNIFATAASLLALISMLYSGAVKVAAADALAAAIPDLRQRVETLEKSDTGLSQSVEELKGRRAEDAQAVQGMRTEIIGRLDRIEIKIDQKADKQTSLREWTK